MSKIVIVGAGWVGATTAYALIMGGTAEEIVLIDKIKEKARSEAMDLSHCASFVKPVRVYGGDYKDCTGAEVIIIAAGAPQVPGQSRLELVETNTRIINQVVTSILDYTTEAILLIVTNPVDIMSYVAWKVSGFPSGKVIGSGTVLDTSRFRHLISIRCGVDPRNVHAYVVGEHGDTEVPLWSTANIAGVNLELFCRHCERTCGEENRKEISHQVRQAAYVIIEGKGATYYAIALVVKRIVESILRNEHSVFTVSTLVDGIYGIRDLYLSLPCIISNKGVERVIPLTLDPREEEELIRSAETIKSYLPLVAR